MTSRWAAALFAALLAAIPAGSASADFFAGLEAHDRGDYETAHAEWLPLAEAGDAAAQANLGVMYLEGQGVDADPAEAARWFTRAAERGHPAAQNNLGQMYYEGEGVPKNLETAARWIKAAAYQGDPNAQLRLGTLYDRGIGVDNDKERALLWWGKSAAQGNAVAQARIAEVAEPVGADHDSERVSPPPPSAPAPASPAGAVSSRPPAAAAPAVVAPTSGGFVVQIASVGAEEDAEPEWARLQRRNQDLLGDLDLDIQKSEVRGRVVYRLRAGPPREHAAAKALCEALEQRRLGCLVREAP